MPTVNLPGGETIWYKTTGKNEGGAARVPTMNLPRFNYRLMVVVILAVQWPAIEKLPTA